MRPKRRNQGEKSVLDHQSDHELFLQAFEKPTQIYRFLKTRCIISPVFLPRTLYYMKDRMSRNNKNKANFKIDSLLKKLETRIENQKRLPGNFLNIEFTGFFDKICESSSGDIAKIETFVLKMSHKKRKESSAPLTQVPVGIHDVLINPPEEKLVNGSQPKDALKLSTKLSIATHHFTANSNGHQVKSYLLVFKVSLLHDQENACEPQHKRRRVSRNLSQESNVQEAQINGDANRPETDTSKETQRVHTTYGAELVVYDRHSRCQLCPGQYELIAYPLSTDAPSFNKSSPRKNLVWESFEDTKVEDIREPFHSLDRSPMITFNLSWTGDDSSAAALEKNRVHPLQPLDIALANSNASKPKPQGVASPEAPQLVLYQFVYNNSTRQQTEARYDFHCPWCSLKCCALYSLLKHLKLSHGRFLFTYVPHPKGARIDVSLNEVYDGSYSGNPQDLIVTPSGSSFSRSGPVRRSPTTSVLVCLPKRPKPSLSEFLEQDDNDFDLPRSYILGHNRLYHHTNTCLPVQPHELDVDSEGEHDSEWVRTKTRRMIDDFSDVNEGEKQFMKLWNLHVMKYNFVGDCQVPLCCYMFTEMHSADILKKNLYRNFVVHLASLIQFGIIGSGTMYKCISILHSRFDENLQSIFLSSYKEQIKNCKIAQPVKGEKFDHQNSTSNLKATKFDKLPEIKKSKSDKQLLDSKIDSTNATTKQAKLTEMKSTTNSPTSIIAKPLKTPTTTAAATTLKLQKTTESKTLNNTTPTTNTKPLKSTDLKTINSGTGNATTKPHKITNNLPASTTTAKPTLKQNDSKATNSTTSFPATATTAKLINLNDSKHTKSDKLLEVKNGKSDINKPATIEEKINAAKNEKCPPEERNSSAAKIEKQSSDKKSPCMTSTISTPLVNGGLSSNKAKVSNLDKPHQNHHQYRLKENLNSKTHLPPKMAINKNKLI